MAEPTGWGGRALVPAAAASWSRRGFLRAGLVLASAVLTATGCAAPGIGSGPRRSITRKHLVVVSNSILPIATELARAWDAGHPSSQLVVLSQTGPAPRYVMPSPNYAHADVGEQWGDGMEISGLKPYLSIRQLVRQANFNLSVLPPSGVHAFEFAGDLFGLPLMTAPLILLVNTAILRKVGIAHPSNASWTLGEIQSAVAAARASKAVPSSASLIVGLPWTDVRIWGAFVLGLGGSLTDARGTLDFAGSPCIKATQVLAGLATAAKWSGVQLTFAPDALFTIQNYPCLPRSMRTPIPGTRFPVLPNNPVIPAYETNGLTVPVHCQQPTLATEFILWLYEPNQQRLLMSAGVPPIVTNQPALQAEWARTAPDGQRLAALLNPGQTVDILGLLPQGGYAGPQTYNSVLGTSLSGVTPDLVSVRSALTNAQSKLSLIVAKQTVTMRCLLSQAKAQVCPAP